MLKERESLAAPAARFELHSNQISQYQTFQWKQEFLENSQKSIFLGGEFLEGSS